MVKQLQVQSTVGALAIQASPSVLNRTGTQAGAVVNVRSNFASGTVSRLDPSSQRHDVLVESGHHFVSTDLAANSRSTFEQAPSATVLSEIGARSGGILGRDGQKSGVSTKHVI
jgi:hypothetical protein